MQGPHHRRNEAAPLRGSAYAPENLIVVGIQGCWGWSIGKGLANPALDRLCKGRDVFVAFDADVSSNPKVYDAADSLNLQLSVNGAKSVKFVKVPGSKTVGLDDYLTSRDPDNRAEPMAELLTKAGTFLKLKKPPRPKASSALNTTGDEFDYISFELGEVVEAVYESIDDKGQVEKDQEKFAIAGEIEGMRVRRKSTLLQAAPSIVAAVEEKDDLTPGADTNLYYDIDLQIGPAGSRSHYLITDVADKDLASVREWIARAGTAGSFAQLGRGGQGISGQTRIAEAMRGLAKSSGTEKRTTLLRTGWYQEGDTAYWVDSGGAHGPDGKITSIKSRLEGSISSLEVPGYTENYDFDDVVASVKTMLDVCNYLYDPTPWIAAISGTLWAAAGGSPDAVLYFVGGAGSGKSSITGAFASMLGPRWGTGDNPMASVEGTEAYLSDVAKQIHNCVLVFDDARDRSSSRSQENQDNALDAIIRVGYSGGGAARGKKVEGKSKGSWRNSTASFNRPFIIIAGETLPDSAPQSTIERCLVVEIKGGTSMKAAKDTLDGRSGLDNLVSISRSGALRPMLSYFLHTMSNASTKSIRDENQPDVKCIDDIRLQMESVRGQLAEKALEKRWPKRVAASERVRQVTATFLAGTSMLAAFMSKPPRSSTSPRSTHLRMSGTSGSSRRPASHSSATSRRAVKPRQSSVSSKAASAELDLLGMPTHPGQTCVGQEIRVRVGEEMVDAVGLIPAIVGQIIGNKHNLPRRLASVLIPGNDGRQTRAVNINGTSVRCLVITADAWYGEGKEKPRKTRRQSPKTSKSDEGRKFRTWRIYSV